MENSRNIIDSDSDWFDLDSDSNDRPCFVYDKFILKNKDKKRPNKYKKKKNVTRNNNKTIDSTAACQQDTQPRFSS